MVRKFVIEKEKWTVEPFKKDKYRELRVAAQLNGKHVGTRSSTYDILLPDGRKVEVKCPDKSGRISIATAGRKAISFSLARMCFFLCKERSYQVNILDGATFLEGMLYRSKNYHWTEEEHAIVLQFFSTFVNGIPKKMMKKIVELLNKCSSGFSEELVKPSEIFVESDLVVLAWEDGYSVIKKEDYDSVLSYSGYSGGLVKLAIKRTASDGKKV